MLHPTHTKYLSSKRVSNLVEIHQFCLICRVPVVHKKCVKHTVHTCIPIPMYCLINAQTNMQLGFKNPGEKKKSSTQTRKSEKSFLSCKIKVNKVALFVIFLFGDTFRRRFLARDQYYWFFFFPEKKISKGLRCRSVFVRTKCRKSHTCTVFISSRYNCKTHFMHERKKYSAYPCMFIVYSRLYTDSSNVPI